ncbi:hypothetical protein SASPL_109328 [Salvia splendens]|uniref:Phloem protein 2-like n=1 Tax=Salvia splendens TaxID=180675 RepID=A0A8X8YE04_SALSN|nr:hypothetical protein SASPL_109328 [Salvia splendens]
MSKNYDNWEKLVGAVLKIEQFRQLAARNSTSCSTISDDMSFSWLDNDAPKIQTLTHTLLRCNSYGNHLGNVPFSSSRIALGLRNSTKICTWAREFVIQTQDSPAQYLPFSSNTNTIPIPVDIRGKIRTRLLTSNTIYGAYLIFKLAYDPYDGERGRGREKAVCRSDRWTEFQIGSFYVDGADEQEMEARVVETSNRWKGGLLVGGIEFRPLVSVKQL